VERVITNETTPITTPVSEIMSPIDRDKDCVGRSSLNAIKKEILLLANMAVCYIKKGFFHRINRH
jgi:hypothetical protein